jgi:hypothetical protein
MVKQVTPNTAASVFYPESDGQPMADNTKQYTWIVTIVSVNISEFERRPTYNVFSQIICGVHKNAKIVKFTLV